MSESVAENMVCPKCGHFQPKAEACSACGVYVAKLRPEPVAPSTEAEPAAAAAAAGGVAGAAAPAPRSPVEQEEAKPGFLAQVAAVAVVVALGVAYYFVAAPKDMSVAEFVEAKKTAPHFRDFRIEGTVEPYREFLQVSTSSGKKLSSLKIVGDNASGVVSYIPEDITPEPRRGDRVRVTGSFQRIRVYHFGQNKPSSTNIAVASSIEVIRAAPSE